MRGWKRSNKVAGETTTITPTNNNILTEKQTTLLPLSKRFGRRGSTNLHNNNASSSPTSVLNDDVRNDDPTFDYNNNMDWNDSEHAAIPTSMKSSNSSSSDRKKKSNHTTTTNNNKRYTNYNNSNMIEQVIMELEGPPSARDAAFCGPPRYDWIDIEAAAAVRVQSIFRRNQTIRQLEQEGITTAHMRNRKRRYMARQRNNNHSTPTTDWICGWKSTTSSDKDQTDTTTTTRTTSSKTKTKRSNNKEQSSPTTSATTTSSEYLVGNGDVPSLFACCGVGLLFGDATDRDHEYYKHQANQMYEEQVQHQKNIEETLRNQYTKVLKEKLLYNPKHKQEGFEIAE